MMAQSRRGFLSLLGIGAVAAPAIVKSATAMEALVPEAAPALSGKAIALQQQTLSAENLMSISDYNSRVWKDWARNAIKVRWVEEKEDGP